MKNLAAASSARVLINSGENALELSVKLKPRWTEIHFILKSQRNLKKEKKPKGRLKFLISTDPKRYLSPSMFSNGFLLLLRQI